MTQHKQNSRPKLKHQRSTKRSGAGNTTGKRGNSDENQKRNHVFVAKYYFATNFRDESFSSQIDTKNRNELHFSSLLATILLLPQLIKRYSSLSESQFVRLKFFVAETLLSASALSSSLAATNPSLTQLSVFLSARQSAVKPQHLAIRDEVGRAPIPSFFISLSIILNFASI